MPADPVRRAEGDAAAWIHVLSSENDVLISARTVAGALIVSSARNIGEEIARLLDRFDCEVVAVTFGTARRLLTHTLAGGMAAIAAD